MAVRTRNPQEQVIIGLFAPVLVTAIMYGLCWLVTWAGVPCRPEVAFAWMAAWNATATQTPPNAEEATQRYLSQWGMYFVYVYHLWALAAPVAVL